MSESMFVYSVPSEADKEELLAFLLKYFLHQESMNRAANMTEQKFKPCANEVLDCSLNVPFSVIARHKDTNELAGILLQSIWKRSDKSEDAYNFGCQNSPVGSIGFVLNKLHSSLYHIIPNHINCVLHREMSCVASHFQRQGIAKQMALYHIKSPQLTEYGIQGIASETTSQANQALLKKLGFKVIKEVHFNEVLNSNGEQLLNCDDGTEKAVLNYLEF